VLPIDKHAAKLSDKPGRVWIWKRSILFWAELDTTVSSLVSVDIFPFGSCSSLAFPTIFSNFSSLALLKHQRQHFPLASVLPLSESVT
jgi:hypothetical protein